jgi:protein-tyrosine phosphatase
MGNICRSPTAEAVFRAQAEQSSPELKIDADSAGTHAYHLGSAPDPRAQRVAAAHGIDISSLRARVLAPADFERFDLILAMDRQNLQAIRGLTPTPPAGQVRLLLDYAPQQPLREVPDPYYGELEDFELVFRLTQLAAEGLLRALRGQGQLSPTGHS